MPVYRSSSSSGAAGLPRQVVGASSGGPGTRCHSRRQPMAKKAPRSWGYWTEGKLDILARYLDRFTTTTKYKADARIYLDAFAGEGHGTRSLLSNPLLGWPSPS